MLLVDVRNVAARMENAIGLTCGGKELMGLRKEQFGEGMQDCL
jgi:hypothetical protein